MKKLFVLLIILAFLAAAFFLNIYFQKLINPRKSPARLLLYFLTTIVMILGLTTLMIFIIGRLFPQEIMK